MSLVDKVFRQVRKRGVGPSREHVKFVVAVAIIIAVVVHFVLYVNDDEKKLTSYKPEIRLNSLIVCSDDNVMFWDLKFNITNPNDYSVVYTSFEASILSFNQSKLLTKASEVGIIVSAKNHTSGFAYAEASLEDLDAAALDQFNRTIRFDLKFNAEFHFRYGFANDVYHSGDLVCRDAKVALLPPSSSSFCGSLLGDPLDCSYQSYYKKSFWQYHFLD